jgi:hypothetical protein
VNNLEIVRRSQIDGEFEGFDEDVLFKLMDGTYWVQDEYRYWYHYSYCPQVSILAGKGRLFLQVDGQSEAVAVRQIHDVVESKVNGEFKGWDGDTKYELTNGQIWQQSRYKYKYKYAYMPKVLIYNPGGGHIMQVADTSANVRRIR